MAEYLRAFSAIPASCSVHWISSSASSILFFCDSEFCLHITIPMLLYMIDFYAHDRARISGSFGRAVREEIV